MSRSSKVRRSQMKLAKDKSMSSRSNQVRRDLQRHGTKRRSNKVLYLFFFPERSLRTLCSTGAVDFLSLWELPQMFPSPHKRNVSYKHPRAHTSVYQTRRQVQHTCLPLLPVCYIYFTPFYCFSFVYSFSHTFIHLPIYIYFFYFVHLLKFFQVFWRRAMGWSKKVQRVFTFLRPKHKRVFLCMCLLYICQSEHTYDTKLN